MANEEKNINEAAEPEVQAPAEPTAEEKLAEAQEKFLRLAAEYDNFRKRTAKEHEALYSVVTGDVIASLLEFVDDFERASAAECTDENYKKGIELVSKKLYDFFKQNGVEEISTSEGFNPELHNAIMHEDDPDKDENIVGEVFRKGYTCKGRVVRHSLVKVIN